MGDAPFQDFTLDEARQVAQSNIIDGVKSTSRVFMAEIVRLELMVLRSRYRGAEPLHEQVAAELNRLQAACHEKDNAILENNRRQRLACDGYEVQLAQAREQVARLELTIRNQCDEMGNVMFERDAAEDALLDASMAMDGPEWAGKLPPEDPPNSGDLKLDVPELCRQIFTENQQLRDRLAGAIDLLETVSLCISLKTDDAHAQVVAPVVLSGMKEGIVKFLAGTTPPNPEGDKS